MNEGRVSCFLLGLAVGSAAALLFAPKSGRQTRRDITDAVAEGKDQLADACFQVQKTATDLLDRGMAEMQKANRAVTAGVEAGKSALARIQAINSGPFQ